MSNYHVELTDIVHSFSQTGAFSNPTPQDMMLAAIIRKLNKIEDLLKAPQAQRSGDAK